MDKHQNSIKGEKQIVEWYIQYDAISEKLYNMKNFCTLFRLTYICREHQMNFLVNPIKTLQEY